MARLRGGDAASGDAGDRAHERRPWPWSWRGPSCRRSSSEAKSSGRWSRRGRSRRRVPRRLCQCGRPPRRRKVRSGCPVHAEVTELLSNVIYQHRRRAGQGGRSPRKESPLGRAVVWRVLGWSQARCGFEGRRRSQGRKQHGSFQLVFAGSRIRLCKNGIRPAIDRALFFLFLPTTNAASSGVVVRPRRGTASTVSPRPTHTHQVQHHLQTLHNQATTTTTTHRTHATYIPA